MHDPTDNNPAHREYQHQENLPVDWRTADRSPGRESYVDDVIPAWWGAYYTRKLGWWTMGFRTTPDGPRIIARHTGLRDLNHARDVVRRERAGILKDAGLQRVAAYPVQDVGGRPGCAVVAAPPADDPYARQPGWTLVVVKGGRFVHVDQHPNREEAERIAREYAGLA